MILRALAWVPRKSSLPFPFRTSARLHSPFPLPFPLPLFTKPKFLFWSLENRPDKPPRPLRVRFPTRRSPFLSQPLQGLEWSPETPPLRVFHSSFPQVVPQVVPQWYMTYLPAANAETVMCNDYTQDFWIMIKYSWFLLGSRDQQWGWDNDVKKGSYDFTKTLSNASKRKIIFGKTLSLSDDPFIIG